MTSPLPPTPRNVRLLYLHNFLNDFRFQAPFLIVYFNQVAGSYAAAMSVLALEMISGAVMDIPTGILSDRVGRKLTIGLGSVCYTLAVAFYAFASGMIGLCIGAVFFGLGRCLYNGNNTALMYESLKAEGLEAHFSHYHGRAGGMFQLALALSALCGGWLATYGLQTVFVFGIVPQFLSVLLCFFFREPRVHHKKAHQTYAHLVQTLRLAFANKRLLWLIMGQGITYGAGESSFTFKAAFVSSLWPAWAVGLYRALNHVCGFLGFWFAGRVVGRWGASFLLVLTESACLVIDAFVLVATNVASPVLLALEAGFFGPYSVARDQLLQNEFTDAQRATLGSVASFTGSVLYALCAVAIGAVSDLFGLAAGLWCGVVLCGLALPVYVHLFRRHF